jgi:O-antigen ligase
VHQRVIETTRDLSSYQWNTSKPDDYNSVGARIAFIRIAVYLFEKKPLSGWGDGNFGTVINDPGLDFSLLETKKIALEAGFHNDITANMVRSGIWGLIATVALFLVPAIFFIRNLRSEYKKQRDIAFIALAFLTCQFTSSLSMEIFNLRYSASFYGLMIAAFCGQIIFYMSQQSTAIKGEIK